ncbi:recombinase family protein [Kocuria sabuli]|uniref:recombinase family protein n=1 Tax=Kocuria sabuli TaxID=3071448 RepID=UPI0034D71197
MARFRPSHTRSVCIAYCRVSTEDQAERGASLDAQRSTLIEEADRRDWEVRVVTDEKSAKDLNRPGLQSALADLDEGRADHLMAVRLDRVSRSVADFAGMLDRANRKGWGLVMLSPNIDTSDPAGRFTSNVLASAAQYERELIGVRTREGMAQRKAEGVRMGRPRVMDEGKRQYIRDLRASGLSMQHIADRLNAEGVPTARGGKRWYASTVNRVLTSN